MSWFKVESGSPVKSVWRPWLGLKRDLEHFWENLEIFPVKLWCDDRATPRRRAGRELSRYSRLSTRMVTAASVRPSSSRWVLAASWPQLRQTWLTWSVPRVVCWTRSYSRCSMEVPARPRINQQRRINWKKIFQLSNVKLFLSPAIKFYSSFQDCFSFIC